MICCPVCKSQNLVEVESVQEKKDEGWVYLSKILKKNKQESLKIADSMRSYKCLDCFCYSFLFDLASRKAKETLSIDIPEHIFQTHKFLCDILRVQQLLPKESFKKS